MPVLGAATLELNADAAKLEGDLGATVAKATAFGTAIGTAVVQGIGMAVRHMVQLTTQAIDTGDQLDKMSQKIGISVEHLSQLRIAAALSDVSLGTLKNGIKALADNSTRETGQAANAFKAMGIDVKQFGGDTEKLFTAVMTKLGSYKEGANQIALANAVMGRSGIELLPMANELEKNTKIARELGLVMSTETAQGAAAFKDNMKAAHLASEAMGARVATVLLPTLEKLSGWLVDNAKHTEKLDTVTRVADTGLKLFATAGTIVGTVFKVVGDAIGATAATMHAVATGSWRQAYRIQKEGAVDMATSIGEAVGKVSGIWEETGNKVNANAEKNGEKLAAPAIVAAAKVKKAKDEFEEFRRTIMRVYDDAANAAAADQQIQKQSDDDAAREARARAELLDGRLPLTDDEKMAQVLAKTGEKTKEVNSWAREMGLTFTSAFEQAALGGKKLQDVLLGLARDIAAIAFRKAVTEPIGAGISAAVSKGLGGFDVSSFFGGGTQQVGAPELDPTGSLAAGAMGSFRAQPAGGVVVHQNINFSANTPAAVRDAMYSMLPHLTAATKGAVAEDMQRGNRP